MVHVVLGRQGVGSAWECSQAGLDMFMPEWQLKCIMEVWCIKPRATS